MKILIFSPVYPQPLDMGSKIRVHHIFRELTLRHDVTFISLADSTPDKGAIDPAKTYRADLTVVPGVRSRGTAVLRSLISMKPYRVIKFHNLVFREKLNRILKEEAFDLIWVNFMNMLDYLDTAPVGEAKVVLDLHNADILFWRRFVESGNWMKRLFALQNIWKLRRMERRVLRHVDLAVAVSTPDADYIRSRTGGDTPVWILPNGIDTGFHQPASAGDREDSNRILLCGAMDVGMNIDAACGFVRNVFPLIREARPDAVFRIVGRNPASRVRRLALHPGVEVYGDVSDVRPHYAAAKIAVAPYRFGGGTKIKILEAMAAGVPVVATGVGGTGLEADTDMNIIIADTPETMAERIIRLLSNRRRRDEISRSARKLVEKNYSWDNVLAGIDARLAGLVREMKSRKAD